MKTEKNTLASLGEIAKAVIPVFGFYSGHSEGVKEGYAQASDTYERKTHILKDRMRQIRRDVLGDNEIFIFPAGWNEEHWIELMSEFLRGFDTRKTHAKEILLQFIMFCHDKFPQDKLAETRHQLEIINKIISLSPAERFRQSPADLELAVRFLDVFGHPDDLKNIFTKEPRTSTNAILLELLKLRDEIKACMDSSKGCNILTLGKTGTGKSALLNYLIGQERLKTGTGKPVTKKGIFPTQTVIDGLKATVYDSWGIEAGDKFDEWQEMLEQEKQRHDLRQDVSEWFHAVIYCVQASGARVEDIDINIINSFLQERYHIIVVITKADLCSEEDETTLRNILLEECSGLSENSIIGICSVSKTIRTGTSSLFGIEKLKKEILDGYKETIINRLPKRCIYLATNEIDKFRDNMVSKIQKMDIGFFDNSDNENWLKKECDEFLIKFNQSIFPTIIRDEFQKCTTIGQNLSCIIDYKDDFFESREGLFTDNDEWYDKAGKVFLMITVGWALIIPAAIYAAFTTKENDRKKMSDATNRFCEKIIFDTKNREDELYKKIKSYFSPPKALE